MPSPSHSPGQDGIDLTRSTISSFQPELMPGLLNYDRLEQAADFVRGRWPEAHPKVALVLGSGWGTLADIFTKKDTIGYPEIPWLGAPTAPGHAERLIWGDLSGVETFVFQGRRHLYEGVGWTPVGIPAGIARQCGAEMMVLCSAVGGIRVDFDPGNIMLVRGSRSIPGLNPLVGPHREGWSCRFPDMSHAYSEELRDVFRHAAKVIPGLWIKEGVLGSSIGPSYEMPEEIKAMEDSGVDAVGMSAVNEVIMAHAWGLKVAAVCCVSNYAANSRNPPLTEEEVEATLQKILPTLRMLFQSAFEQLSKI